MKRWKSLVLLGALALALPPAGRADDGARRGGPAKTQWRERAFDRAKEELGLSDEQAGKLEAAFQAHRKAAEPLRDRLKVAFEKLRWQVDAKASPKELSQTLDELDQARAAMREDHEKFRAELSKLLTPEQRAKMTLWRGEMMLRRHRGFPGMMRGGPGGMGPGRGGPDRMGPGPHGMGPASGQGPDQDGGPGE